MINKLLDYTSLDQVKDLLDLGLDPNTADLIYTNQSIYGDNYTDPFKVSFGTYADSVELMKKNLWPKFWEIRPCWSLGKLINIIEETGVECLYDIHKKLVILALEDGTVKKFYGNYPIDCIVDTLKFILQNK